MLNSEIKYSTSNNYNLLYDSLREGTLIIGFIAIEINGVVNMDYSKLVQMTYNPKYDQFDLGFIFWGQNFDKEGFKKLCERQNVRFLPLN